VITKRGTYRGGYDELALLSNLHAVDALGKHKRTLKEGGERDGMKREERFECVQIKSAGIYMCIMYMCVCQRVCVFVCVCVFVYAHTNAHKTHTCMYIHSHIFSHIFTHKLQYEIAETI